MAGLGALNYERIPALLFLLLCDTTHAANRGGCIQVALSERLYGRAEARELRSPVAMRPVPRYGKSAVPPLKRVPPNRLMRRFALRRRRRMRLCAGPTPLSVGLDAASKLAENLTVFPRKRGPLSLMDAQKRGS